MKMSKEQERDFIISVIYWYATNVKYGMPAYDDGKAITVKAKGLARENTSDKQTQNE